MDAFGCALDGCNLIEASAGTGKTYTIETLYLRLIVEKALDVEQILIVTFTKLATAELQERLRKVLLEARNGLRDSIHQQPEGRITELLKRWRAMGFNENMLLPRFQKSLSDFDRAPISTIHGFCQRVLQENAFESRVRFGRELMDADEGKEVVDAGFLEFFRKQCYDSGHPLRSWLMTQAVNLATPSALETLLSKVVEESVPDAEIAGVATLDTALDEACLTRIENKLSAWLEMPPEDVAVKEFLECLRCREPLSVQLLPASNQAEGTLKELVEMLTAYKAALLRLAKGFATAYLAREKSRQNFFTYNDLLNELSRRLREPLTGEQLCAAIRRKYPCAIIDEFQDTDPVQNAIFSSLYIDSPENWPKDIPACSYFMIGDPKQAIYAFRGGDLPAYQAARDKIDVDKRYQLNTNFRSSQAYIGAMNKLFHDSNFFQRFELDAQVEAPANAPTLITSGGDSWPPSEKLISKKYCKSLAAANEELVSSIQEMIQMGLIVQNQDERRPLNYGDIAVLTSTNKHIREVEQILTAHHIPCSTVGNVNVLAQPQASLLLEFLQGLQNLSYLPQVVRLMALPFFPWTPCQIEALRESGWPKFQAWLIALEETWRKRSFLAMFEQFLGSSMQSILGDAVPAELRDAEGKTVAEIIAGQVDGHESLAIFRQLAEYLHEVAMERRLGPTALFKVFRDEVADPKQNSIPEQQQLRMTTEKPAVRVMTIHKSKGLQFSCVFVYGFLASNPNCYPPDFYHQGKTRIHLVDQSLEGDNAMAFRNQGQLEMAEEALRKFYVAITRARFFVRFLDGKILKTALLKMYLSGENGWPDVSKVLPEVPDFLAAVPPEASETSASESNETSAESERVAEEFPDVAQFPLHRGWHSNSFTSLSKFNAEASRELAELLKDDDENEAGSLTAAERALLPMVLRLPRGMDAGTRWHKLFEELDFQASDEMLRTELPEKFASYGLLEDAWSPALKAELKLREQAALEMVGGVLNQELPRPLAPGEVASEAATGLGFCLRDVLPEQRRAELHFTYWLKADGGRLLAGLSEALQAHGIQVPDAWSRTPTGAITGSIDLLFQDKGGKYYILDWKTNVIGNRLENYLHDGMKAEMDRHFYHLQYLIYTVAFLQFYRSLHPGWELTQASYDALFGGVFYVFLRGVSRRSGARGFFATRPTFELVQGVDAQLGVCENQITL